MKAPTPQQSTKPPTKKHRKRSSSRKSKKDEKSAGIEPTDKTIQGGTYPLSRPLFFYTKTGPSADIKAFIDWVLSPEGQGIVTKVGYFPIK